MNYIYSQTIVYGVFMSYDKQERMSALEESDEVFNAKMTCTTVASRPWTMFTPNSPKPSPNSKTERK